MPITRVRPQLAPRIGGPLDTGWPDGNSCPTSNRISSSDTTPEVVQGRYDVRPTGDSRVLCRENSQGLLGVVFVRAKRLAVDRKLIKHRDRGGVDCSQSVADCGGNLKGSESTQSTPLADRSIRSWHGDAKLREPAAGGIGGLCGLGGQIATNGGGVARGVEGEGHMRGSTYRAASRPVPGTGIRSGARHHGLMIVRLDDKTDILGVGGRTAGADLRSRRSDPWWTCQRGS